MCPRTTFKSAPWLRWSKNLCIQIRGSGLLTAACGARSQGRGGSTGGSRAPVTPSGTRHGTLTGSQLQFIDGFWGSRSENSGGASDSVSDSGGARQIGAGGLKWKMEKEERERVVTIAYCGTDDSTDNWKVKYSWERHGRTYNAVRKRCYRCGAAREDLPVSSKGKGNGKGDIAVGPLGRKPPPTAGNVPPTTRRPQVVPPRGPPGAGVGSPPTPESPPSPPSEDLVKALQLLQSVLTPEDFSKYEKKLVPPKQQERVKFRERELLEAVERQANYEKQEQKHLEMIAKHEHNLTQQKAMLESVRTQLAEVWDTVGALRALVSETKEPPINSVVPPLPPPREPPLLPTLGSAQDFLPLDTPCTIHTQYDLDTDMEDETGPVQSKSKQEEGAYEA